MPRRWRYTFAMTAILVLAGAANLPAAGTAAGQVRVQSDPPEAVVTCDGIMQEVTPMTLTNLDAGPHLIVVSKPGFAEGRRTVLLSAGQRTAVEMKLDAITGLMLVHTEPAGADVEINGAHRGKTPMLITDLPLGTYRVKTTAPGYASREVEVKLEDRTPRRVMVSLASDSAKLVVESVPAGGTVVINGVTRGTAPCEADRVPPGETDLEVTLADYFPQKQHLKLQSGEEQLVRVILKPVPPKTSVTSTPPGAKVFADEQLVGETPATLDKLTAGQHVLRVELQGYETETRTITLQNAETHVEDFRLTRNSGTLEITTEPAGVKVFVDGQDHGTTKAGEADVLSEPYLVDLISRGEHRLQLTKKGFFSLDKTFLVEPNKTVSLHEKLKRRFIADTVVHSGKGAGDIRTGALSKRLPNGDIELETQPGIFVTIKAGDIISVEPAKSQTKE